MEWMDYLGWIVGIAMGAFAVYLWVTGRGEQASTYWAQIAEATKAAEGAVAAAQQLWESGQIHQTPEGKKDPRFLWALERLQKIFPNLSEAVLEMTIEASVFWIKHGMTSLNVADNTIALPDPTPTPAPPVAPLSLGDRRP